MHKSIEKLMEEEKVWKIINQRFSEVLWNDYGGKTLSKFEYFYDFESIVNPNKVKGSEDMYHWKEVEQCFNKKIEKLLKKRRGILLLNELGI